MIHGTYKREDLVQDNDAACLLDLLVSNYGRSNL